MDEGMDEEKKGDSCRANLPVASPAGAQQPEARTATAGASLPTAQNQRAEEAGSIPPHSARSPRCLRALRRTYAIAFYTSRGVRSRWRW
jgi:hypothetical protein